MPGRGCPTTTFPIPATWQKKVFQRFLNAWGARWCNPLSMTSLCHRLFCLRNEIRDSGARGFDMPKLFLLPAAVGRRAALWGVDRKSTRLNSSHTVIYTLSLHDALPIFLFAERDTGQRSEGF